MLQADQQAGIADVFTKAATVAVNPDIDDQLRLLLKDMARRALHWAVFGNFDDLVV